MTSAERGEGVIQFKAQHDARPLSWDALAEPCARLDAWRSVLKRLGVVGQLPGRYQGAGFGNLSARLPPYPGERGHRPFVVTGTQTGGVERLGPSHWCVVQRHDHRANQVVSRGPVLPSSESMTHGAIYDLDPRVRCVIHAHAPDLWHASRALRLPTAAETAHYGTPEMVSEVMRLYRDTSLADVRVLAMGGHQDGVLAFGHTTEEAGLTLTRFLARAWERTDARQT
jgi:hypothetical protein